MSGPAVGCGDSAVQVSSDWPIYGFLPTDIKASLENLFAIKAETLGQSGLSHALHQANLHVEDVTLTGSTIHIALQGDLPLQGACMDARSHAQILHTVFQYEGFDQALITLNGQNLKQIFNSSGLIPPEEIYDRSDVLLPFDPPTNNTGAGNPKNLSVGPILVQVQPKREIVRHREKPGWGCWIIYPNLSLY